MARFTRADIRRIVGDACTDEIENQIIALHLAVVDPLKDDVARYKADADKLTDVQKELDGLKANNGDDYKTKYETEHSAFEDYKKSVQTEKDNAVKTDLVRAYFESKGITGKNLDIAMRGAVKEIESAKLADGKLSDTAELDALLKGDFAGLVVTTTPQGASTQNPPSNGGGGKLSRADIYKKDEHGRYVMSTAERQKALAESLQQ